MLIIEVASIEKAGKLLFRSVKMLIIDFIYVLYLCSANYYYKHDVSFVSIVELMLSLTIFCILLWG